MSPEHQSLNVSRLCVACVSVWSWSALQFALQDLKIFTICQILHVHPLFVLCCIVCYKRACEYVSVYVCVCVCVCVHVCGCVRARACSDAIRGSGAGTCCCLCPSGAAPKGEQLGLLTVTFSL